MLDIGRYLVWPPVGWLETEQPRTTSFMEYRQEQWQNGPRAKDGKAMRIRQQWVSLKRIAPALRQAVVTSEDDLFWKHDGFNFSQMYDALKRNWDKGRMAAGGSTISQQLAKNLWFTPERSILRKLKEAIMTWRLELALDKERILELYLNVAEWGNGVYGAEAAAGITSENPPQASHGARPPAGGHAAVPAAAHPFFGHRETPFVPAFETDAALKKICAA